MKTKLIPILVALFVAAGTGAALIFSGTPSAEDRLFKENIAALAQNLPTQPTISHEGKVCVNNISYHPYDGWDGMWVVYCGGCVDAKATSHDDYSTCE